LTINSVSGLLSTLLGGGNLNLPATTLCTSCTKAAYNIANKNFPDLVSGGKSTIEQTCGQTFIDGTNPSGISQSSSNTPFSAAGNAGGAATLSSSQAVMSSVMLASLVLGAFAAV